MRILVVCSDTGVRIGDGKGASLHLRAIAHAFAALGHQVEVVGIAPSNPDDAHGWTVPVHLVPHPGRSEGLERERRKLAATEAVSVLARDLAADLRPELIYERLALFGTAGLDVAAHTGARHVLEVNALLTAEESAWRGLNLVALARRRELAAALAAAQSHIDGGRFDQARQTIAEVERLDASAPDLANLRRAADAGIQSLEVAAKRKRDVAERLEQARKAFDSGGLPKALQEVTSALGLDPANADAKALETRVLAAIQKQRDDEQQRRNAEQKRRDDEQKRRTAEKRATERTDSTVVLTVAPPPKIVRVMSATCLHQRSLPSPQPSRERP